MEEAGKNKQLLEELTELETFYKRRTGVVEKQRQAGYQRAIFAIKIYTRRTGKEITDMSQVRDLSGIGKNIRARIKQFLEEGHIRKALEIRPLLEKKVNKKAELEAEVDPMKKFISVWGVGPVKSKALWDAGVRSVVELRGRQDLLTTTQSIGLKYYDDLQKAVPRKYSDMLQLAIRHALNKEYGANSYKFYMTGSYRRGAETAGHIDSVSTSKVFTLEQMVETLKRWGIITEVLALKGDSLTVIADSPDGKWFPIRLDIEFVPEENVGATLIWFTGSKGMNINLRSKATNMGWKLTQHGIHRLKDGSRIPAYSEKEIFEVLGVSYIEPDLR
jgi:DNA polymerase/3'-5' exonuclease PolX